MNELTKVQEATEVGVTKKGDGTEKYQDIPSVPSNIKAKLKMYYQFEDSPPVEFGASANPVVMIGFSPKIRSEIVFTDKETGKKFRLFALAVNDTNTDNK